MASKLAPPARPEWLAHEERTADRVAVSWVASISSRKFSDEACRIVDITHLGCRVQLTSPITVGAQVTIAIADFAELAGWVAWHKGGEIGVDFSHPLPAQVLDSIIARHGAGAVH
jgi:hypothetical protein